MEVSKSFGHVLHVDIMEIQCTHTTRKKNSEKNFVWSGKGNLRGDHVACALRVLLHVFYGSEMSKFLALLGSNERALHSVSNGSHRRRMRARLNDEKKNLRH